MAFIFDLGITNLWIILLKHVNSKFHFIYLSPQQSKKHEFHKKNRKKSTFKHSIFFNLHFETLALFVSSDWFKPPLGDLLGGLPDLSYSNLVDPAPRKRELIENEPISDGFPQREDFEKMEMVRGVAPWQPAINGNHKTTTTIRKAAQTLLLPFLFFVRSLDALSISFSICYAPRFGEVLFLLLRWSILRRYRIER